MNAAKIKKLVLLALAEDIGRGDITTNALVTKGQKARARIVFKTPAVVCGLNVAAQAFKCLDPMVRFKNGFHDGDWISKGKVAVHIEGSARAILTAERVALNFISRLSGIATQTRAFVEKIKPHKTVLLDTRKTTPLLRDFERYAVRCGGGSNHRFDLNDMAMIKDNHRALCGNRSIKELVSTVRQKKNRVEVEVDTLAQLRQALDSSVDIILLDNMSVSEVRQARRLRDQLKSNILLEVSGGITLANAKAYAATGVERISVGAITHSPTAVDVSLELIP